MGGNAIAERSPPLPPVFCVREGTGEAQGREASDEEEFHADSHFREPFRLSLFLMFRSAFYIARRISFRRKEGVLSGTFFLGHISVVLWS